MSAYRPTRPLAGSVVGGTTNNRLRLARAVEDLSLLETESIPGCLIVILN